MPGGADEGVVEGDEGREEAGGLGVEGYICTREEICRYDTHLAPS